MLCYVSAILDFHRILHYIDSMRNKDGTFQKGKRYSPSTEFKKGEHWRERKPFWQRDWLDNEYTTKKKSANEIASRFGVKDSSIYFWLKKHGIKTRSISETRKIKYWGSVGEKNPMYGKRGILNPQWRGGLTPERQRIYASSEWRSAARAVRKRDKVCRLCGSREKTEIHHVEPFSQSPLLVMDIGNLILLCHTCHVKMIGKEKRWRKKLYSLIKESEKGGAQ